MKNLGSRITNVIITLLLYIFFYILPLAVGSDVSPTSFFVRIWAFAGILIVSALAGYLSKSWLEPAIATTLLTIAGLGITLGDAVVPVLVFCLLSLLGSWLGVHAYKLWRSRNQT